MLRGNVRDSWVANGYYGPNGWSQQMYHASVRCQFPGEWVLHIFVCILSYVYVFVCIFQYLWVSNHILLGRRASCLKPLKTTEIFHWQVASQLLQRWKSKIFISQQAWSGVSTPGSTIQRGVSSATGMIGIMSISWGPRSFRRTRTYSRNCSSWSWSIMHHYATSFWRCKNMLLYVFASICM